VTAFYSHADKGGSPEQPEIRVCAQAEEVFMTSVSIGNLNPPQTPPCPVCGGETALAEAPKAVAKVTDIFRCKRCNVEYPVARKPDS
jgi:tRNA(Ile2) C34 agmatinyltransferase TiaS